MKRAIEPGIALRWGLATGILLALVVVVECYVGWGSVLSDWSKVPLSTLAAATALMTSAHVVRGLRLFVYLRGRPGLSRLAVVRASVLHTAVNNILPMRLGEAALPLLLRPMGIALHDGVAGLVWIRLFDLHALCVTATVFVMVEAGHAVTTIAVLAALLLALWAVVKGVTAVAAVLVERGPRLGKAWAGALRAAPPHAARLYAWTLSAWALKWAAMALVFSALLDASTLQTALGVVAAELSSVLPVHGLAGAGTYEAAVVAGLVAAGAEPGAGALAAAVNLHLFVIGVSLLLAVIALPLRGGRPRCQKNTVKAS